MYAALTSALRRLDRRHSRRLQRARRFRRDRIEISTEAVYRFAAREFNPHDMTRVDANSLIALLFGGGAIRRQERRAMQRAMGKLFRLPDNANPGAEPIDLIHALEWMERAPDRPAPDASDLAKTLAILRLVDCRRL